MIDFIAPNWPAPAKIKAYSTMRAGGFSQAPFANFNLSYSVGDDAEVVKKNRGLLRDSLQLPTEPFWLSQVHGVNVVKVEKHSAPVTADASYTRQQNTVCVVSTADCLPVLLCDRNATCVAAIHAGWRGLAAGVIEQTINALQIPAQDLLVWLGPAIGPEVFEVGEEVFQQFCAVDQNAAQAFKPSINNRWLANIYLLAKQRLTKCDVTAIYGGEYCTYSDSGRFFSYRRDKQTGRMASLIWMDK
jgi:YfiH family protein